jgi:hypothetical protein
MKQFKKRSFTILLTMVIVLGYLVVPSSGKQAEAASKLKVTCSQKTIAVNCSTTIKTNVKAKFASSNKKIATVSSKGVVKGKKAGKVKITVTSKSNKKQKKTVTITVKNQLVITAPEKSSANLYVGDTVKIKTNLSSKYTSSDTKVATVNSSGKVTAKSAGTAKITVTAKSNKKLKKTVTITVQAKQEPTTEQSTTQTTTDSTTESTVTPNPGQTTETPTVEQPSTEKTTTEQTSTTEEPTTEQPSTQEPTTEVVPVGITAEYKGIAPNSYVTAKGMIIYLNYSDGTNEIIPTYEYEYEYVSEIEKDGKKYLEYNITYQNFTTILDVETEEVPEDVPYVCEILCNYNGTIQKGSSPDIEKLTDITLYFTDGSSKKLDSTENVYYIFSADTISNVCYFVVYDYYFQYNEKTFYTTGQCRVYIPYE